MCTIATHRLDADFLFIAGMCVKRGCVDDLTSFRFGRPKTEETIKTLYRNPQDLELTLSPKASLDRYSMSGRAIRKTLDLGFLGG